MNAIVNPRSCLKSSVKALKGRSSIAGGVAPGGGTSDSDPERVALQTGFDPFRVGNSYALPGALPPAIKLCPCGAASELFTQLVGLSHTAWSNQFSVLVITIVVVCFACSTTVAQTTNTNQTKQAAPAQPSANAGQATAASGEQSPAHKYFTDVVLVNQNGEKMRFYSDLLRGKVVIINSFFGTCQGSCLPMNHNLEKVQQALGDRVGKDVHIISISVDPKIDTPERLKEYAKGLQARPGWYFITGDKQNVDFALGKIGHAVNNKEDHLNIIIVGNEPTGLWKKAFGLAPANELVKVVESVLNDQLTGNK